MTNANTLKERDNDLLFPIAAQLLIETNRILIKTNTTSDLEFYGLYKQSMVGTCTNDRPGYFDVKARAKHDAWMKYKDVSNSKSLYIDKVMELLEPVILNPQDYPSPTLNQSQRDALIDRISNFIKQCKDQDLKGSFEHLILKSRENINVGLGETVELIKNKTKSDLSLSKSSLKSTNARESILNSIQDRLGRMEHRLSRIESTCSSARFDFRDFLIYVSLAGGIYYFYRSRNQVHSFQ